MRAIIKSFFFLVILAGCSSQKAAVGPNMQRLEENLKVHIQYLADDKLEGRRAGSNGEKLAMEYIAAQFRSAGLAPKGTAEYFQAFDIREGRQINEGTSLIINGTSLDPAKDFFPFPFSANKKMEALPSIAVQEADMPWFYDLKDILDENKNNPHFNLSEYVYNNAKKASDRGASAIILYNTSAIEDKLVFNAKDKSEKLPIPVIYIQKDIAQKFFTDQSVTIDLRLQTDLGEKKRLGHNVAGYIDNGAPSTVILGAHFDHLGYGEDGNSMHRTGEKAIHNGADDNASGTAALIELARIIKTSEPTGNNYLFLAFSGEELGLFGSKYFTENPTIDLKSVAYMINMDMVGRLNDSSRTLTIGGIGTSPVWGETLPSISHSAFTIKYDSSGTGPSDHTSFYRKDIPVLFYFTGLHQDYHKPTDDAPKVNYKGEAQIIQHIHSLINAMSNKGKPSFTKTREMQTSTSATFKVTLGIMPDYTYSGTGVRADDVTEGRPAAKARLKAGDIITKIGDHVINSLENYMQALGKFEKGQKTTIKFLRGTTSMEATVEF